MFPSNPNVIRANPLLETYRTLRVLWFIMLVLFLIIFAFIIVFGIILGPASSRFSQLLSHSFFYFFLFLIYLSSFISTSLQQRYWKRIERRRLAAKDPSLLALEQPIANPIALPLPCTIKVRTSKNSIPMFIGIVLVYAFLLTAASVSFTSNFLSISPNPFYNSLALFAIIAVFLGIVLLIVLLSSARRQKVEVTERGVSANYVGQKGFVPWEDARLFAMYNSWGAQKNGALITYELSSASSIVRWLWIVRPGVLPTGMEATIPFDEYTRQMQALNALIVARTNLPLVDLRQEPAADVQPTFSPSFSKRNV